MTQDEATRGRDRGWVWRPVASEAGLAAPPETGGLPLWAPAGAGSVVLFTEQSRDGVRGGSLLGPPSLGPACSSPWHILALISGAPHTLGCSPTPLSLTLDKSLAFLVLSVPIYKSEGTSSVAPGH